MMDLRVLLGRVGPTTQPSTGSPRPVAGGADGFAAAFRQALASQPGAGVKVTAHAAARMSERGMVWSETLGNQLSAAIDELGQKGARDSLIMLDEAAFVVNVPSRTLVTALDIGEMQNRIVTKIDSVHLGPGPSAAR